MASKINIKPTFEAARTIEPIYTGGDVSLDKSGQLLATCVEEDALIVNIESGETVVRIENDGEPITSLALSPSASHLVVCSRSLSMRIYGLNAFKPELQRTLKPHTTPVITSTIDATGTLLATGGADGTIKVWDIRGGFTTHTFHGHGGIISALCFFQGHPGEALKSNSKRKIVGGNQTSNDAMNFFLASGGDDGKIRIWNLQTRKPVASLDSHVSVVRSLDFSEQQRTLLSASRDKTMILWDSKSWKARKVIPVLEVVEMAGFVLDGSYCYSGGENGKIRIWSILGNEVTKEQVAGSENDSIVGIQRGPNFLLSVHLDQMIQIHDLRVLEDVTPGTAIDPLPILKRISGNHDEIIDMALVGPERSLVALATNTESVRIISVAESSSKISFSFGSDVALLSGHSEIIICVDVDWSGHWLASGAKDNSARLWRLDPATSSYTCFAVFIGHAESLGAVSLPRTSSSSQAISDPLNHPPAFLLTGSQDRTIKRWDTSKLKVSSSLTESHSVSKALFTRVAHERDINAIDVSSTSPIFASASQDRTIKIWDLESGSVAGILRGHKRGVWSIRFAPKDTPTIKTDSGSTAKGLLVSGSGDRTVKLWSLSTYTCILTFEGHSNSVLKVIWLSPPAQQSSNNDDPDHSPLIKIPHQTHPIIASSSSDTLIKLWSPYTAPSSSSSPSTINLSESHLLTTLDNHSDRVWALATPTTTTITTTTNPSMQKYPLLSASASATLTLWTDTTTHTLRQATTQANTRILQDQALQNHLRTHNYREAISLSLTLNHPGRLLTLFEEALSPPPKSSTITNAASSSETMGPGWQQVSAVLTTLSEPHLYQLLLRIRDWNTNARTAPVAQRLLNLILKSYPLPRLLRMARPRRLASSAAVVDASAAARGEEEEEEEEEGIRGLGKGGGGEMGMRELFRSLEVYTERHLNRLEGLVEESYLIEYTLGCMDEILVGGGDGGGDGDGGCLGLRTEC